MIDRRAAWLLLASCVPSSVLAQVEDDEEALADPGYVAAFFAQFQPQTALDMVARLPGFTLSDGAEVRGFGGAAGNVLIDGKRPTVKSGGVSEVLRRIPAGHVERILLLRGGAAAEAQGQSIIADIRLKEGVGGSGTATAALTREPFARISPSASVSYARAIGGWQLSAELSGALTWYGERTRFAEYDASGTLFESSTGRGFGREPNVEFAASAAHDLAGGRLSVNTKLQREGYRGGVRFVLWPGNARRAVDYDDTYRSTELGGDWSRSIGSDWTAKLIGLWRRESGHGDEDLVEPGYRGVSGLRYRSTEAIGRLTIGREGSHAIRPEIGAEVAWNSLNSVLAYAEDIGAGLVPVTLSGADTRVSELRGEAFVNINARLGATLRAEVGAAVEFSRIRVSHDASAARTLSYLKPSAALIWSAAPKTELRLGMQRTVGQLDFGDFAASVSQLDGREIGGNADLRPTVVTRALVKIDHRWGKTGAISAEVFHEWHDGLLGYIPLPSGDQGVGSLGNGRQIGISLQSTLPLDALLDDARLTTDATLLRTRVTDPVTGERRRFDTIQQAAVTAEFRHDIRAIRSAWGVQYTAPYSIRNYFLGESLRLRAAPVWSLYAETTAFAGLKTVLRVDGANGGETRRMRHFYAPDRAGLLTGSQSRIDRLTPGISLTLSRGL